MKSLRKNVAAPMENLLVDHTINEMGGRVSHIEDMRVWYYFQSLKAGSLMRECDTIRENISSCIENRFK